MSPTSATIFSAFGGIWLVFAILFQDSPTPILRIVPIVIAAALAGWSISVSRNRTPLAAEDRRRLNKIVMYASIFEGVAILVGINILNIALSLVIIGIAGIFVGSQNRRAGFVGVSSALVLWTAAIIALRPRKQAA
jgi:hypothetical protein